jgi:hypothetical protein
MRGPSIMLLTSILLLGCSAEEAKPEVVPRAGDGEAQSPEAKTDANSDANAEVKLAAKSDPAATLPAEAAVQALPKINYGEFSRRAGAKMDSVMDRPAVDRAMGKMWDDIGADPKVSKAGGDLLGKLAADPELAKVTNTFMAELPASPEFVAMIQKIAMENPGASEAELQLIVGQHVEKMGDRPEFDAALDKSLDRFLDRPQMQEGIEEVTTAVMNTGAFTTEVSEAFARKFSDPKVGLALQTKSGADPSSPDYERKLMEYVTEPARLEAFVLGFCELFGRHEAPRTAVAALLNSDPLAAVSVQGATKIMEDPIFKARAQAALVALLTGAEQSKLEQELDDLLSTPVVEESFSAWFREIGKRPELEKGIGDAFRKVARDPEFDALIEKSFL